MRYLALVMGFALPGCFTQGPWCDTNEAPCPSASPDPCEGQCVPFVGGGWDPVLVVGARQTCPEEAPFEAMSATSPPLTACGVQEADGTCSSAGYVCLPSSPAWAVCLVRDGQHVCPSAYREPFETGMAVTICCLATEEPG